MKRHGAENNLPCETCGLKFRTKYALRCHQRLHTGQGLFNCDKCEKIFVHKCKLLKHLQYHDKEYSFLCDVCEKGFYCKSKLLDHKNTHTGERPFGCNINSQLFETLSQIMLGSKMLSPSGAKSVYTNGKRRSSPEQTKLAKRFLMYQVFNLDSNDKTQLGMLKKKQVQKGKANSVENGQTLAKSNKKMKTFKCKICDKIFGSSLERQVHTLSHKDQNEWVCPTCKRKFAIKKYLLRHLPSHVLGRNLACETCGRKFRKQFELRSHKRIHTGEGVYTCVKCGKKFVHKSILNNHLRYHAKEYSCNCNICGKGFHHKSQLDEHMNKHTGERSFSCDICGMIKPRYGEFDLNPGRDRLFSLYAELANALVVLSSTAEDGEIEVRISSYLIKSSLSYHKIVHTGENNNTLKHECVVCGKFYVNLMTHLKHHTRERNFLCCQR
uniref:(California timema) hypothetical protein n=1 Tax=Timema californicum TaxID=61474 RepID=A0A7R9IWX8_TIMCA|nr:unnamed protein product [Timema californicum]